ncbi:MAG: barstar family protein [Cardiobacteriaceae bacterium]|nr:barstar family protein [Cardiobacteriaceae bacterium]
MLIEIYGKDIYNELDFHRQFNKYAQWTYYGHNLNALWDVLRDMELPTHLIWYDSEISKARLGERFTLIVSVLEDAYKDSSELYLRAPKFYTPDEKFTYELK